MKKNIAILILVVIAIFSMLYGYTERIRSVALVEEAVQCETEAHRQRQIAEEAMRTAEATQQMLARTLLEAEKQKLVAEELLRKIARK